MMISQALLKTLYEVVALPLTIRVVKRVKTWDSSDVYDRTADYRIFKLS